MSNEGDAPGNARFGGRRVSKVGGEELRRVANFANMEWKEFVMDDPAHKSPVRGGLDLQSLFYFGNDDVRRSGSTDMISILRILATIFVVGMFFAWLLH